jgi:hypothetical protein
MDWREQFRLGILHSEACNDLYKSPNTPIIKLLEQEAAIV